MYIYSYVYVYCTYIVKDMCVILNIVISLTSITIYTENKMKNVWRLILECVIDSNHYFVLYLELWPSKLLYIRKKKRSQ